MKRLLAGLILISFFSSSTLGDGYIQLINRKVGVFDAPIHVVQGDQSCLIASLELASGEKLLPQTKFRNDSPAANAYLQPAVVRVQGKQPGDVVQARVVIYGPNSSQQNSDILGMSDVFEVTLGTWEEPGIPSALTSFAVASPGPSPCDAENPGYILLSNRVVGVLDGPIWIANLTNQASFRASLLFLDTNGTGQRLYPETNFRDTPEWAYPYLYPVLVPVPGKKPGDTINVWVEIFYADPTLPQLGQTPPMDVKLGTKEEPGLLVSMPATQISSPPLDPCSTPSQFLRPNVRLHGDHLMLYPQGLCENGFNFTTEFSEDLVTWAVLPSYIRDTVVSGRHRYYRYKWE